MPTDKRRTKIHIVLDVETTGLTPQTGAIWQLGAVAVVQHTAEDGSPQGASVMRPDRDGFSFTVKPRSACRQRFDYDTIEWQLTENRYNWNAANQQEMTYEKLLTIGLPNFTGWIHKMTRQFDNSYELWAQGADFDFPFLVEAYKEAKLWRPWEYRQQRDLRTLRKMFPIAEPANPNPHDALSDAFFQAKCLANIFNHLTELGVSYG